MVFVGTILGVACLFGWGPMAGLAMNSDTLLPYSYAWDVGQHANGWRMHELARIPSFLPDFATLGILLIATGSERLTIVLYAMTQALAFVYLAGFLAARLSGKPLAAGAAMVSLLFAFVVALEMISGDAMVVMTAFFPVDHFGPFLFSLLGGWIGAEQVARPRARNLWLVAAIAMQDYLSDQLLLIEFAVPLLGAGLLLYWAGRLPRNSMLMITATVAGGLLAGGFGYALLVHAGMRFETPLVLWPRMMLRAAGLFARSLPGFAADHPIALALGFGGPLAAYLLQCPLLPIGRDRESDNQERTFLWLYAGLAMAGMVVFTAFFYENRANHRYLIAVWTWLLIFAAAAVLRMPALVRWLPAATVAGALSFIAVFVGFNRGSLGVLQWDTDTAACLRKLQKPLSLHAGLADYWESRSSMVASQWSLQVDQIYPDGRAYLWGNDPNWYLHDRGDASRPPDYDFIVMRKLDPASIRAVYGEPVRIEPCGETAIWIYRDPGGLYSKLLAVSPDLRDLTP